MKYKDVIYYGIIITHSQDIWYALMNKPIDRLDWMNDHERMFLVCQPHRKPERITVSGYTLRHTTGRITIIDEEEAEIQEELLVYPWMEQMLKEELASFSE